VLGWALGAAILGVAVVWLLLPTAADPFGPVNDALQAHHTHGTYTVSGVPVIVDSQPASSQAGAGSDGSATGSPVEQLPPFSVTVLPDEVSPPDGTPAQGDAISSDIARARANGKSSQVAVQYASNGQFAVAPAAATGTSSALPALLAVAVIAGLAGVGGALLARGKTRQAPQPAPRPGGFDRVPPALPPGTEPVASPELRRLRQTAGQKTALARSVAELVPSMPDALAWQAEKALAEAGVHRVVPDGQPFNAAFHYAVGTEPTPGRGRENTVARTVRPGYSDENEILVYPKVVVYANEAGEKR
jgi:hypothetical protein